MSFLRLCFCFELIIKRKCGFPPFIHQSTLLEVSKTPKENNTIIYVWPVKPFFFFFLVTFCLRVETKISLGVSSAAESFNFPNKIKTQRFVSLLHHPQSLGQAEALQLYRAGSRGFGVRARGVAPQLLSTSCPFLYVPFHSNQMSFCTGHR